MRNTALPTVAAALVLFWSAGASAQLFGPKAPPQNQAPSADQMAQMCTQMKSMPNPPMTYEACMQMAASQAQMQAAQNNPAGFRPGDDAMTCDQLKAEFVANGGVQMNQQHVAQAQAAGQHLQQTNAQVTSEGMALQAQETATTAAAAAASMVPGVGSAAAAAAAAKNNAEQQAFGAHATAVMTPAEQQASTANAQVMSDMTAQMQSNPRQARLIALMQQKNCRG